MFSAIKAFMYLEGVEHDCLPKLIITDLYLPRTSRSEFLTDLKNMEKYQQMGALDYLDKPQTFDEYVQVAAEMSRKALI